MSVFDRRAHPRRRHLPVCTCEKFVQYNDFMHVLLSVQVPALTAVRTHGAAPAAPEQGLPALALQGFVALLAFCI